MDVNDSWTGGSGCNVSLCQLFCGLMVKDVKGLGVRQCSGCYCSFVQDRSAFKWLIHVLHGSDWQAVESMQSDNNRCFSIRCSSGQWLYKWWILWWLWFQWSVVPVEFPVVSGSIDDVVLQAQLYAAIAVRTTQPAAQNRRTAAMTMPVWHSVKEVRPVAAWTESWNSSDALWPLQVEWPIASASSILTASTADWARCSPR